MDWELIRSALALQSLPKVGPVAAKNLIAYTGSADAVFTESTRALMKIPGIGKEIINRIKEGANLKKIDDEVNFIVKHNIKVLYYLNQDYPYRLKEAMDSPILLFYKGNADLNQRRILAIVGTRKMSAYGKDICANIVTQLQKYNVLTVSGLAAGIDTVAHKQSIENNLSTVGVMGTGMQHIYPASNRNLAINMLQNGGLLTEFWSYTHGEPGNFPARNRIVAGISDCTLVVETAIKGGAMITAQLALNYDRDIFSIPGRIGDKQSEGCNYLIRTQKATLVTSGDEIAYHMRWDDPSPKTEKDYTKLNIPAKAKSLVKLLSEHDRLSIDVLTQNVELTTSELNLLLLELEMVDIIEGLPGKYYRLKL
ncbi:MAG: DNA-processing protein DprA [Bacteroidota bacterium]|nr:DNA-processing protein DprA [Bacteroidota bacterium]